MSIDNIKFDVNNLKTVAIDEVRPNTWNPKDKKTPEYLEIVKSIKTNGLRLPIYVRESLSGEDLYEIVDGEQRWTAAKEIGLEVIGIYNFGSIDEKEAQELTLWFQHHVPFDTEKLIARLDILYGRYKDLNLPYAKSKVEEMRQALDFNWGREKKKKNGKNSNAKEVDLEVTPFLLKVTEDQYGVIMRAVDRVQELTEETIDIKQSVLHICKQYL